jgi:hypothetical protein
MTTQIDKKQAKMQKLADDNTKLEAMKQKAIRQIEKSVSSSSHNGRTGTLRTRTVRPEVE